MCYTLPILAGRYPQLSVNHYKTRMKSLLFSLLLFLGSSPLFSQELTKDAFIGSWKVVDSQILPEIKQELDENGKKIMEQMRASFMGTLFNFTIDGKFTIQFVSIAELNKELEFLNNTNWKIQDGQMIVIGTEDDNYSLMGIYVLMKEGT